MSPWYHLNSGYLRLLKQLTPVNGQNLGRNVDLTAPEHVHPLVSSVSTDHGLSIDHTWVTTLVLRFGHNYSHVRLKRNREINESVYIAIRYIDFAFSVVIRAISSNVCPRNSARTLAVSTRYLGAFGFPR